MEEGELTKRILEKVYLVRNGEIEYGTKPPKEDLDFATIEFQKLMKVLGEAKAEFPHGKEGETSFRELAILFDKRTEWFLKWFGNV